MERRKSRSRIKRRSREIRDQLERKTKRKRSSSRIKSRGIKIDMQRELGEQEGKH